jgi:hypothetical protein
METSKKLSMEKPKDLWKIVSSSKYEVKQLQYIQMTLNLYLNHI